MQPTYYRIQILLCVIYCSTSSRSWKEWADRLLCSTRSARHRFEYATMSATELLMLVQSLSYDFATDLASRGRFREDSWVNSPHSHFEKVASVFGDYLLESGYVQELQFGFDKQNAVGFQHLVCIYEEFMQDLLSQKSKAI